MSQSEEKIGFISHLTELRKRLNKIWDMYEAGKLSRREKMDQINEQWEMWNKETYDRKGWELKHK